MPDKTLKVVTYAAGASLAAITLIYVFGPTYFLDSDTSSSLGGAFSTRKKGIVGLENPANDCFINSVLQALAGLGDLRLYLIREVHRRSLDDGSIYSQLVPPAALAGEEGEAAPVRFGKDIPAWKLEGLQRGSVTKGLKEILDALNERPIYKKTISAAPFVRTLEEAFRQRVSRQQQDAQEFLQVVAERLCDEYHAGRRARLFATRTATVNDCWPSRTSNHGGATGSASPIAASQHVAPDLAREGAVGSVEDGRGFEKERRGEDEEGFPLQGRVESQIECLTCGFTPRPTASTFCTLTLHVPQVPATTLGACFDGMFKTEYIDDFKCEKCRLLHALALFESDEQRSASEAVRRKARAAVESLRAAIETDPENPPEGVTLPDLRYVPRRRIARHFRITEFPRILAIHLSRSIFDVGRSSQKNSAKVAFPEELRLGGLLQQRKYKLLGLVTHKGSHHSGHYESFRRQTVYPPFSNPSTFQVSGVYSRTASPAPGPRGATAEAAAQALIQDPPSRDIEAIQTGPSPCLASTPARSAPDSPAAGSAHGEHSADSRCPTPAAGTRTQPTGTVTRGSTEVSPHSSSVETAYSPSLVEAAEPMPATARLEVAAKRKQPKQQARWWRISDDKVKEASTREVLGMQREVYLLFYELERPRTP